jgi:hypothetical protein
MIRVRVAVWIGIALCDESTFHPPLQYFLIADPLFRIVGGSDLRGIQPSVVLKPLPEFS